MELFAKIINGCKPLAIISKGSIVDVWPGFKYTFGISFFFLLGMVVGIGTISESEVTFCREDITRLLEWNENESSFDIVQP